MAPPQRPLQQAAAAIAPEAAIVAVKMGSGDSPTSTDVMRGIKFILDCAALAGMPCVVNLSYGTNKGSHQGQSLFETYMDAMAQQGRTVIVCASGNEGDSGHHFYGKLTSGGVLDVEFTVSTPREAIFLTLWKSFADIARFEMICPLVRPRLPSPLALYGGFPSVALNWW